VRACGRVFEREGELERNMRRKKNRGGIEKRMMLCLRWQHSTFLSSHHEKTNLIKQANKNPTNKSRSSQREAHARFQHFY